ncbi:Kv channel-interacting protein isoform 3 [Schistosoma japonicum]|uniref:Kv channel-interacting protein isoform 3 n=1 Tax=Schistosoma japonicum TaxID=6182 RepID=A0A4Z2CYZ5_SCHJA|nr:Kv channel-interacting protein 1 [Schistosoma japonicum]TNN09495.1 Kv channel-interacting protein isoform 3 [Schistosoma japonicum]
MYGATTSSKKGKHLTSIPLKNQELQAKPISIRKLEMMTNFTRKELQLLYQGFKNMCPSGVANKESFIRVYQRYFPNRASSAYAQLCFRVFDKHQTGELTFEQFACGLSQLTRGSSMDKIKWIFALYDINNDGYISKSELRQVVQAIYELLGDKLIPGNFLQSIEDRVNTIFTKYDLDQDGKISKDEFLSVSTQDSDFMTNLSLFDTIT